MIPDHRLAVLLEQVRQYQISKCLYHNPTTSDSLFSDHLCDRNQFPLQTVRELTQKDEIWFLAFSHDGRRLATCGQDCSIFIYDITTFQEQNVLSEHTKEIRYVAWSPDDTRLISCSNDCTAIIWDMTVCITNEVLRIPN
jgi:WD repeat-containing protein 26